jgi:large subunit ribosomal protein L23
MRSPEQIIKRPLLTEKGNLLKETGGHAQDAQEELDPEKVRPQVLFEVARDANKVEIRRAVEKLWNVNVLKVRTSIVRGKEKRLGRFVGRRSNWKRALVTLAPGQNIEFLEGV